MTKNLIYVDFKAPKKVELPDCDCNTTQDLRKMQIECKGRHCKNNVLQRQKFPKTEVRSAGEKGFGLFAVQKIPKNTIIGEYTGEVLNSENIESRLLKDQHFYAIQLTPKKFIDASIYGSTMRFINHSCDPNCETQTWFVGDERRIALSTIREIKINEEITFDYQFEQWGGERQVCYCQSKNCTGFMDKLM